jgi:hypothetical protein
MLLKMIRSRIVRLCLLLGTMLTLVERLTLLFLLLLM